MKICYCKKSHYKTDNYIKRYFRKFESFKFFVDKQFSLISEPYDIFVIVEYIDEKNNILEYIHIYNKERFEKYFTTEIKVIINMKRKQKLLKIKKSIQN